jgi:hypothetical protein
MSAASASTLSRRLAATAACLLRAVPRIPDRRGQLLGAAWNVDHAARRDPKPMPAAPHLQPIGPHAPTPTDGHEPGRGYLQAGVARLMRESTTERTSPVRQAKSVRSRSTPTVSSADPGQRLVPTRNEGRADPSSCQPPLWTQDRFAVRGPAAGRQVKRCTGCGCRLSGRSAIQARH